jgi:ParB-like nuclease family protein
MRFAKTDEFHVDELDLDEKNYRFIPAADQGDAISKIYTGSPGNFKNMMQSIAEDDLDQPLLVLKKNRRKIVADGNRRVAALKVLYNPELAPNSSIKKLAIDLVKKNKFTSFNIATQISSNRDLVLLTVYERHAAGKGVSSIPWNAFGNALFRFENVDGIETNEWHSMALISQLCSGDPELLEIRTNKKYSHEVFRRLVRAAKKSF